MSSFSQAQMRAFAILPRISGCLSIAGSSFVLQDILRNPEKRKRTYSRLQIGISIFDIMAAAAYALSTWPIPADEPPLYASGNTATCTAQGFFTQMSIGIPAYNVGLALYYLLILVYKWPDRKLHRLEPFAHGVAISLGLGTAIAGLPLKVYNNSTLWCWISSMPQDCQGGNSPNGTGGICERGQNAWVYRWAYFYAPLLIMIAIVTVIMICITSHVTREEKISRKWRQAASQRRFSRDEVPTENINSQDVRKRIRKRERKQDKLRQMSNRVFWQSIYYVLAIYLTYVFPTTARLMETLNQPIPPFVLIGMCMFMPLHGFWNCIIYIRLRCCNDKDGPSDSFRLSTLFQAGSSRWSTQWSVRKHAPTPAQDVPGEMDITSQTMDLSNYNSKRRSSNVNEEEKQEESSFNAEDLLNMDGDEESSDEVVLDRSTQEANMMDPSYFLTLSQTRLRDSSRE